MNKLTNTTVQTGKAKVNKIKIIQWKKQNFRLFPYSFTKVLKNVFIRIENKIFCIN